MKRRIFKSAISVMLCAALLTVSMFTVSVFADDTAPSVKLKSATVRVDDSIGLKVTVSAKNVKETTVKLIADGTEYSAEKNTDGDFEAVVLKYPVQMMDKISLKATAVGIDGVTYTSAEKNDYTIAGNLEELYKNEGTSETTKNFIAKLANYGAYTQIYAAASKGRTLAGSELANYFLDDAAKTPSSEAYTSFKSCYNRFRTDPGDYSDCSVSATVLLQSKVSLLFRLENYVTKEWLKEEDGIETHLYLGKSVDDPNRIEMEEHLVYDENNEPTDVYYTAKYGSFAPTEYGNMRALRIFLCDNDGKLLQQTFLFEYAVGAYIKNKGNPNFSDNPLLLRNLVNAMAEYSVAAKAMNDNGNA